MEKPVALGADHGGFALKEGRHVLGRRYRANAACPTLITARTAKHPLIIPIWPCLPARPLCAANAPVHCCSAARAWASAWRPTSWTESAPAAAATLSVPNTHACTTTPTPFVWAGALSARALPANWWTCFWTPPSKAAAMRAASPRYPRWSSADIHAEPSRKAEHKGD